MVYSVPRPGYIHPAVATGPATRTPRPWGWARNVRTRGWVPAPLDWPRRNCTSDTP